MGYADIIQAAGRADAPRRQVEVVPTASRRTTCWH